MRILFTLLMLCIFNLVSMAQPTAIHCDPETGICSLPPLAAAGEMPLPTMSEDTEIIYVGDPMCSWCWGISPALHQLEHQAEQQGIPFRIVLGGLRPGGGDAWDTKFQDFLKHHWEEVNERSGQPFGYELFERETFNYDTEPACRSVIAAREMNPELEHRFFELVSHHFYVRNQDPALLSFYKPICETLEMDFVEFGRLFESEMIRKKTLADFQINRQWGVTGFPTVILRQGNQLVPIARGFSTYEQMWKLVEQMVD